MITIIFLSPNIFLPEIIEILNTSQNRPGKKKQLPTWVSPIDFKKTQKRQKFPVSREIYSGPKKGTIFICGHMGKVVGKTMEGDGWMPKRQNILEIKKEGKFGIFLIEHAREKHEKPGNIE